MLDHRGSVLPWMIAYLLSTLLASQARPSAAQAPVTAEEVAPASPQPDSTSASTSTAPVPVATGDTIQPVGSFSLSHTRYLVSIDIGSWDGYNPPATDLEFSLEQPIRSFEAQLDSSYSPPHKTAGGAGTDTGLRDTGRLIYWRRNWGPWFSEEWAWQKTPDFTKQAYFATPGVVLRVHPVGIPSRLYLGYVVPTGKWAGPNELESSRTQGLTVIWDGRISNMRMATLRVRSKWGFYRILEQGNPLCDGTEGVLLPGCGRTRAFDLEATIGFALEFPKSNPDASW